MMRSGAALATCALVASWTVAASAVAQTPERRDPYLGTLQFGAGLVDIPVAWISPTSGDVWLTSSAKRIDYTPGLNFASTWNTNIAMEIHWMGRFSTGFSAYSQNPEWGFFGQLLVARDGDLGALPAISIGVRNLGKFNHEDRLLVGHDLKLDSTSQTYREITSVNTGNFKTAPTLYAVATKSAQFGGVNTSFTLGYGNGLFSEDGKLGKSYNNSGTVAKGLFFGARAVTHPSADVTVTFMGENNGFDWNAGIVGDWRGVYVGLYGTELEEGGKSASKGVFYQVYNYAKPNVTLGYTGNVYEIARGVILRARVDVLEREQRRLGLEIAQRNRRIAGLEVSLRQAQQGELATIAKRREELEAIISSEREQIRKAQERLDQIQRGARPPEKPPQGSGAIQQSY
ncbi:MAG: hypothetical protein ABJD07_04990 [Gemmatimonadaceae bacterium]